LQGAGFAAMAGTPARLANRILSSAAVSVHSSTKKSRCL
jgi:hypothetical protein